ncbi:autotransporter outer membrane beta-barrel domain-containing protein [Limnobaculum xujianqingii]|uniref:autotransporter outer membrane beta-barrel domain-containing protein n=1 Tax=Limnobaculum xujianqingii TaxID=2738837 RepID=UPI00112A5782|nr:autotransporter outer membrane beta-barrel domain-containing protein [Limnobaculum xujianqingii]
MKKIKKTDIAILVMTALSIYPATSSAYFTAEWNNTGTDYHADESWNINYDDSEKSTTIIGNTDQTIHAPIDSWDWFNPHSVGRTERYIVGNAGGNASIIFEKAPDFFVWSQTDSEIIIGSGTNSVGEVTLLSSGKTLAHQNPNSHSMESRENVTVGSDGGDGKLNIVGTGFGVSADAKLFIGDGTNSSGQVSVLSGGKLLGGGYSAYLPPDSEIFDETNIGTAQAIIGYNGGQGTLIVNGKNSDGTATSRAALHTGTIVGSGANSVGQIFVSDEAYINAVGYYEGNDTTTIDALTPEKAAFVIGHNSGTGFVTIDNGTLNVAGTMGKKYFADYDGDGINEHEEIHAESIIGEINVGYSGQGTLVVKNQGTVNATRMYEFDAYDPSVGSYYDHQITGEQGLLSIAKNSNSTGSLYIGSLLGDTISEAGYLNVSKVLFGEGQGSVNFNHSNTDYIFDTPMESTVQGLGNVNVYSGVTILNPVDEMQAEVSNTYSGSTTVYGGELQAGRVNVFSANSFHDIQQNGLLNLNDYDQTIDSMHNAGTVSLSGTGAQTNTRLTISHDYVGNGGSLILDTVLGDDNSETDKVIIEGQASGLTYVMINNAGGTGGETVDGIEIITTQGSTDDAFVKGGRIVAGAYEYDVAKSGNNWYLVNYIPQPPTEPEVPTEPEIPVEPETPTPTPEQPDEGNGGSDGGIKVMRPESGAYIANLAAANTMFLSRLHDRLGETQYTDYLTGETKVTSMWLRQEGGHNRSRTQSGQAKTQTNRYVVQIGGDVAQWSTDGLDRLNLGVMAGYGYSHGNTDAKYSAYRSKNKVDGYALGLYGTWYANQADKSGLYVDSWVQYAWFDNTVQGDGLAQENYDSKGWLASLETGYSFKMGQSERVSYWLQPKAQVTWMGIHADKHYEANGTKVTGNGDNLSTRLGLRAYRQGHSEIDDNTGRVFQPFVEANWIYNSKNFGVAMNGVSDYQAGTRNIGEVKVGLEAHLNNNLNMWGSIGQQIGGEGYSDTQAIFGIKYSF